MGEFFFAIPFPKESIMIAVYIMLLVLSIAFFYFTSDVIANAIIRFVISVAIFAALSILFTVVVSKGHTTPPGAKTVDIEEMKRIRKELNKEEK